MTEGEARGFIQGKLNCMERCDRFDCKNNDECDNCEYCYSQGTFGEQTKALQIAKQALEKQIPGKPIFQFNISDTNSRFVCRCGNIIKVHHDIGIMDNNDVPNYCSNCGQKLDWESDEECVDLVAELVEILKGE